MQSSFGKQEDEMLIQAIQMLGLPQSLVFERYELDHITIAQAGGLFACFAEVLPNSALMYLVKQQPHTLILQATALAEPSTKAKIESIFSSLSPLTVIELLDFEK